MQALYIHDCCSVCIARLAAIFALLLDIVYLHQWISPAFITDDVQKACKSIHPSTHYLLLLILCRVTGGLEPIPADSGWEVGYHKVSHVNVHAMSILSIAIQFHLNILNSRDKLLLDHVTGDQLTLVRLYQGFFFTYRNYGQKYED